MKIFLNILTVVLLLTSFVLITIHVITMGDKWHEPSMLAIYGIISVLVAFGTYFLNMVGITKRDYKEYNKLKKEQS